MTIARQLSQLQELDLEIESDEQAMNRMVSQLGENQVVVSAQQSLAAEQKKLDELMRRQRSEEQEIDDLVSKLKSAEEQLYGGKINNPKELTSLQHEVDLLKARRDQIENGALEIMDQAELVEAGIAQAGEELKKLETEWGNQQQQLSADIEAMKSKIAELNQRRQAVASEIDAPTLEVYDKIRKQKGQAVARVEQGICHGCRISLPFSDLQQVKSGNLVQCSSCGRILYQP
ncbi:zinc ribbon domain-containing protein [Chloroflexota bacterium]